MDKKVKVLLVEDDKDFAYLIQKLITQDERLNLVGHSANKSLAIDMANDLKPDLVIMDLSLSFGEMDGIETAKEITLSTGAKVLFLTSFEQPNVIIKASKQAFASGYVFKSQCQEIAETVYRTATSHTPQEAFIRELLLNELSSAEKDILNYMLKGERETSIPSSKKTIANQKTSIFRKLGVKNTNELLMIFNR